MNRRYKFITRKDKLKDKIFRNPTPNDITFAEVNRFLSQSGFTVVRSNGSHNIFCYDKDGIKKSITIANPHPNNSVFPNYIKQIVKLMESIDIEKNQ